PRPRARRPPLSPYTPLFRSRYRRADLPAVAAAVRPYSDEDAAKRIFDAAKPLKAAGIGAQAALDAVAEAMRAVVTRPMVKGEVSDRKSTRLNSSHVKTSSAV